MTELLFVKYESEFLRQLAVVEDKFNKLKEKTIDHHTLEQSPRLIYSDIKKDLTDVQLSVKYMETEMFSFPVKTRRPFQEKVAKYKRQFHQLRKGILVREEEHIHELELQSITQGLADAIQKSDPPYSFSKTHQANQKLGQAVAVLMTTQGISNDIQSNLAGQTEGLLKARTKMDNVKMMLSESQLIVRNMMANVRQNKLTLVLVAVIIILTLTTIIYRRF